MAVKKVNLLQHNSAKDHGKRNGGEPHRGRNSHVRIPQRIMEGRLGRTTAVLRTCRNGLRVHRDRPGHDDAVPCLRVLVDRLPS